MNYESGGSKIRVQHDAVMGLAGFKPGEGLVSGNRGVLRDAPVIVQYGEIGVTQTAVFDSDFNVLNPEQSGIKSLEYQRLFRRFRNPCLIIHSASCSEKYLLLSIPIYFSRLVQMMSALTSSAIFSFVFVSVSRPVSSNLSCANGIITSGWFSGYIFKNTQLWRR
jgi:hypothetical protein